MLRAPAVADEINAMRSDMLPNTNTIKQITVDGLPVEFRAYTHADGQVSVGTNFRDQMILRELTENERAFVRSIASWLAPEDRTGSCLTWRARVQSKHLRMGR
jgi:hypothetical protein